MSNRVPKPLPNVLPPVVRDGSVRTHARDQREAILKALDVVNSVTRGLRVTGVQHNKMARPLRVL